jgi:hypothetical protein
MEFSMLKSYPYLEPQANTNVNKLKSCLYLVFVCFMVFNTTFNNISVISWQPLLGASG